MIFSKLKIFIVFIINIIICFYPSSNNNINVLFLYLIILMTSSYYIFFLKTKLSLHLISNFFIYLFFGIAPIIQYKENVLFFESKSALFLDDFLWGGFIVLLVMLVYNFLYVFLEKQIKLKVNFKIITKFADFSKIMVSPVQFWSVFVLLNVIFIGLNYCRLDLIFSRDLFSENTGFKSVVVSSFRVVVSLVPVFILLYFKINKIKTFLKYEIALILMVVFFNFPMAISRYEVAIVYLPLITVYFKTFEKNFKSFFIYGILIVFPYLHNFRYSSQLNRESYNFFSMFKELHFDTFQNTLNIIKLNLITNGEQLLATLFFFIPRSIWENKPMSSAFNLCNKINYDGYWNIAISYFGEGYINFGFVGLFFFIFLLAFVNAMTDLFYLNKKCFIEFKALYLVLVFHVFYMLRGSLTAANIKFHMIVLSFFIFLLIKKNIFNKV